MIFIGFAIGTVIMLTLINISITLKSIDVALKVLTIHAVEPEALEKIEGVDEE